jgi:hypothetical protein
VKEGTKEQDNGKEKKRQWWKLTGMLGWIEGMG